MGKASSSKKVAKAARIGGSPRGGERRKLGFPAVIVAIILGGAALVAVVRASAVGEPEVHPTLSDHWHMAYGIYICDAFEPPQSDLGSDRFGIHTHADGLIHIHPFSSSVAGENAKFGVFADQIGLELGDGTFTLPDGRTFTDGDDCGGQPGQVRIVKWAAGDFEGEPEIITEDLADVRFLGNGEAYVLAFAPADAEIPLPPNLGNLEAPSDLGPEDTAPDISVPEGLVPSTEAPSTTGSTSGSTSTSAPPAETTTSVPG